MDRVRGEGRENRLKEQLKAANYIILHLLKRYLYSAFYVPDW